MKKNTIAKDTVRITLITLVAGFALGLVNEITKEPIAQQEAKAKAEACKAVFADADDFAAIEDLSGAADALESAGLTGKADVNEAYEAKKGGETVGYVITVTDHEGYGGDIQFSVGVSTDDTLTGISILSIGETAGLGMKAKNADFQAFVNTCAQTVIDNNPADVEALLACNASGSDKTVAELLQEKVLVIGENIQIRRFKLMEGACVAYVHAGGVIGVLVNFKTDLADKPEFVTYGKDVAMQVASMSPKFVDDTEVDADWLEEEKKIAVQQLLNEGKPEAMLERIIPGKMKAILKEVCLVDQKFVKNGDLTVKQYVDEAAKELGKPIRVASMVRFEVGEGIEKKEENFAEEVAKQMGN